MSYFNFADDGSSVYVRGLLQSNPDLYQNHITRIEFLLNATYKSLKSEDWNIHRQSLSNNLVATIYNFFKVCEFRKFETSQIMCLFSMEEKECDFYFSFRWNPVGQILFKTSCLKKYKRLLAKLYGEIQNDNEVKEAKITSFIILYLESGLQNQAYDTFIDRQISIYPGLQERFRGAIRELSHIDQTEVSWSVDDETNPKKVLLELFPMFDTVDDNSLVRLQDFYATMIDEQPETVFREAPLTLSDQFSNFFEKAKANVNFLWYDYSKSLNSNSGASSDQLGGSQTYGRSANDEALYKPFGDADHEYLTNENFTQVLLNMDQDIGLALASTNTFNDDRPFLAINKEVGVFVSNKFDSVSELINKIIRMKNGAISVKRDVLKGQSDAVKLLILNAIKFESPPESAISLFAQVFHYRLAIFNADPDINAWQFYGDESDCKIILHREKHSFRAYDGLVHGIFQVFETSMSPGNFSSDGGLFVTEDDIDTPFGFYSAVSAYLNPSSYKRNYNYIRCFEGFRLYNEFINRLAISVSKKWKSKILEKGNLISAEGNVDDSEDMNNFIAEMFRIREPQQKIHIEICEFKTDTGSWEFKKASSPDSVSWDILWNACLNPFRFESLQDIRTIMEKTSLWSTWSDILNQGKFAVNALLADCQILPQKTNHWKNLLMHVAVYFNCGINIFHIDSDDLKLQFELNNDLETKLNILRLDDGAFVFDPKSKFNLEDKTKQILESSLVQTLDPLQVRFLESPYRQLLTYKNTMLEMELTSFLYKDFWYQQYVKSTDDNLIEQSKMGGSRLLYTINQIVGPVQYSYPGLENYDELQFDRAFTNFKVLWSDQTNEQSPFLENDNLQFTLLCNKTLKLKGGSILKVKKQSNQKGLGEPLYSITLENGTAIGKVKEFNRIDDTKVQVSVCIDLIQDQYSDVPPSSSPESV